MTNSCPVCGSYMTEWKAEEDYDEFYDVMVQFDRAFYNDGERDRAFGCIAYAFREEFRGEDCGRPTLVYPNTYTFFYDITKSRSDDWSYHVKPALEKARFYVVEGTPVRKGDGKRLIEGLGRPINMKFWFR